MNKFYVYELVVVPGGNVCYVGKGSGKRMFKHRANLKVTRYQQTGLYRRLRELMTTGKDFEPRKVFETDDEMVALAEEKRRIELYGFDNLFNSTTRQGLTVASVDEACREAMSKARCEYVAKLQAETGHKMPPEVAAKISAANTGRTVSEAVGHKISESKRGVPLTSTHKAALTGVPKQYESDEAKRKRDLKAGAAIKRAWDSGKLTGSRGKHIVFKHPEERARKISVANAGKSVPAERRIKIAASLRGRKAVFRDPEARLLRISESLKRAWKEGRCKASAVALEAMRKANSGRLVTEATRQKIAVARRQRPVTVYEVVSPAGVVLIVDSNGMRDFCHERGLGHSNLLKVASGARTHARGYRCAVLS